MSRCARILCLTGGAIRGMVLVTRRYKMNTTLQNESAENSRAVGTSGFVPASQQTLPADDRPCGLANQVGQYHFNFVPTTSDNKGPIA